jgi:hypothetical protein
LRLRTGLNWHVSRTDSRGSHRKIPRHPTPPTMYRQKPKWVKSGFGKSVIISPNQDYQDHLDTL